MVAFREEHVQIWHHHGCANAGHQAGPGELDGARPFEDAPDGRKIGVFDRDFWRVVDGGWFFDEQDGYQHQETGEDADDEDSLIGGSALSVSYTHLRAHE